MRTLSTLVVVVTLAGLAVPSLAQQGVRAQSPRRDAGQQVQRSMSHDQSSRHFAGPSNIARSSGGSRHGGGGQVLQFRHRTPHVVGHDRGVFVGGSSVHIGGQFGDVHGGIRLGGFPHVVHHRPVHHLGHSTFGLHGLRSYGYGYGYGYDRYDAPTRQPVVQGPTVIIIDRTGVSTNEVDPASPIVLSEVPAADPLAEGIAALYRGHAGPAVDALTAHVLVHEGDRRAERLLGVALVLNGQTELGIALIARAYKGEPALAYEPLGRETIDSLSGWRRVQRDVQRYAGVHRTASSWLAAIAVTQTELPNDKHAERLEYARRAGLDVDVADALERYLEGESPEAPAAPTPQPAADEPAS